MPRGVGTMRFMPTTVTQQLLRPMQLAHLPFSGADASVSPFRPMLSQVQGRHEQTKGHSGKGLPQSAACQADDRTGGARRDGDDGADEQCPRPLADVVVPCRRVAHERG